MKKTHQWAYSGLACVCMMMPRPASCEDTVSVRSVCFPPGAEPVRAELLLDDGKATLPLEIGGSGFSEEMRLPRMDSWKFGRAVGKPDAAFEEIAKVEPPEGGHAWLVFIRAAPDGTAGDGSANQKDEQTDGNVREESGNDKPRGKVVEEADPEDPDGNEDGFRVRAFAIGAEGIGGGEVLVLNLAAVPIRIDTDGVELKIESEESAVVGMVGGSSSRQSVRFTYEFRGRDRPFVTTNWSVGKGRRRLAVVLQDRESSPPRVVNVDEIVDEPE